MRRLKSKLRTAMTVVIAVGIPITGGCATINYSYNCFCDREINFAKLKTYKWGLSTTPSRKDSLVESNVRCIADQVLKDKGFEKSEKVDLVISVDYDYERLSYQYGYQIRMLSLNVSLAESRAPVWRGMAMGIIRTDAASGDLKTAVQGIISKFPRK